MHEPSADADRLAKAVWQAALEVHRTLGAGFLESAYENALEIEFAERAIPYVRQKEIQLRYKDRPIGVARLDFLIGELVVVELKAVEALHAIHHAQVLNYLRATSLELGLLINFNTTLLKDGFKRVVLT